MRKVNIRDVAEESWVSPKGKFGGASKNISIALGRNPAGKTAYPYHSHSAQWEFYYVLSGKGVVRHKDGPTRIEAGDAFLFQPEDPHTFSSEGNEDLVIFIIADNPIGESSYYPDSK